MLKLDRLKKTVCLNIYETLHELRNLSQYI